MKTLIITGSTMGMRPVHKLTLPSKRKWCDVHNYDLLDIGQWNEPTLCWDRMWACERNLSHYDAVMWIDADAVVTNQKIALADIMDGFPGGAFYASLDWGTNFNPEDDPRFNCGNVIFIPGVGATEIFSSCRAILARFGGTNEQTALQKIKKGKMPGHDSIVVLSADRLNSVPREIHDARAIWEPSHFLAHLTGTTQHERIAWMDRYNLGEFSP